MGKIFDDFHDIAYRGFEQLEGNNRLQKWKEDIFFLMTNQVLKSFQIQFKGSGSKEWAVEFEIKADGSVQSDNESGGINYWEIPNDAIVDLLVKWEKGKKIVDDEMESRGWITRGSYIEGSLLDNGSYSKSGYGATKGRRGSWES
jgi:hypothetical protein